VRLLEPQASVAEVGGTHIPEAYEAYLRGRQLRHQGEAEATLRQALAAFDEAIRLDPAYARAYAGKADVLSALASNAYLPFDSGFEQSRQASKRALELAPDLAEGLLALLFVQTSVDANLRAAAESAERALRLSPGNYDVQLAYSKFESSTGQHERAIAGAEKAVELDPIAAEAHVNLAYALGAARQYDRAERAARQAIALSPDRPGGHTAVGWMLILLDRNDEALAEFDKESIDWQRMTGRALVFAKTGKAEKVTAELDAMHKKFGDAASYQYAQIYATLGNRDEAFRWLANARRVHDPGLMGQVFVDPVLDPLRSDPRYDALVHELGFAG
jgi:tetratricopeptide (TPR) repeat protein